MKKPITDWNKFRDQFVRETLRRASFRWPPRAAAQKAARVGRKINPETGKECWYDECANCKGHFLERKVKLDHIEPVRPLEFVLKVLGAATTDIELGNFVLRMFPEQSGFQVLCSRCHGIKTATETTQRAAYKRRLRDRESGSKR
jgi:5-methylcytosine-specific restriction endonuclease McrA